MKILNFGSLNTDNVYSLSHIVSPGETIFSTELKSFCGGKGLNQSVALSLAGAKVYHAGLVGADGGALIECCKKAGVNTQFIRTTDTKSGHTVIQVDKNGQNSIILYGGANRQMTKDFIDSVLENFDSNDLILLQNEINLVEYIIDGAAKKGMKIVLNPSPFDENIAKCDLQKVSLFLINEIEGEQITGQEDYLKILDAMSVKYKNAQCVLTLGKKGAVYQNGKARTFQPIFDAPVRDTTAAGDTFTGYFLAAKCRGISSAEALKIASMASAIAVSRNGAVKSIPTKSEVESFYLRHSHN